MHVYIVKFFQSVTVGEMVMDKSYKNALVISSNMIS